MRSNRSHRGCQQPDREVVLKMERLKINIRLRATEVNRDTIVPINAIISKNENEKTMIALPTRWDVHFHRGIT